jgi:hypothetical protein
MGIREWWQSADSSVQIHRTLTLLWIVPGLPISYVLRDSVPWVVFMSAYAIIGTHWAAWQAGIVEKKQDEQAQR